MRTTASQRQEDPPDPLPRVLRPAYQGDGACGFCTIQTLQGVRHDFCPREIHTAPGKANDKVWACQCWKEGHT